jgi:hypothetical protein
MSEMRPPPRPPPVVCAICGKTLEPLDDRLYTLATNGMKFGCSDCAQCPNCHGSGWASVPMRATSSYHRVNPVYRQERCWECGGTGRKLFLKENVIALPDLDPGEVVVTPSANKRRWWRLWRA